MNGRTVGSLFAGIGGFDLGFERAGFDTLWQVEQDPYCRAVLAKHFPRAQRFADVRDVGASDLPRVDLLCGGFPCQDLSSAGKGAGLAGARSGLWSEFARLIRELRPSYVVVENVTDLLSGKGKRWDRAPIGRVLGDLSEMGYDAEWSVLSAREFGAPHLRKRVWIVAYPNGDQLREQPGRSSRPDGEGASLVGVDGEVGRMADADSQGQPQPGGVQLPVEGRPGDGGTEGAAAHLGNPDRRGGDPRSGQRGAPGRDESDFASWWATEPNVGRVADGVPSRVDRTRALGNALLPQIAEWIGRRILAHEEGVKV